jgi:plasmid stabilization system protein ParE
MAEAKRAALWSPEALDDRERIWDYYVRVAGRYTAEKILREIAEVIALIEDQSIRGTCAKRGAPGVAFVCR